MDTFEVSNFRNLVYSTVHPKFSEHKRLIGDTPEASRFLGASLKSHMAEYSSQEVVDPVDYSEDEVLKGDDKSEFIIPVGQSDDQKQLDSPSVLKCLALGLATVQIKRRDAFVFETVWILKIDADRMFYFQVSFYFV